MESALIANGRADLVPHISEAIHGFKYFDDTIYLQVFVPDITKLNAQQTPLLIENHTTEDNGTHVAFNENNLKISVTQASASVGLAWIISANESVGNNGRSLAKSTGGGSGSGSTPAKREYFINAMKVNDKKEDWFNGRGEICYAQYRHNFSCGMVGAQIMVFVGKYNVATYSLTNEAVYASSSKPWNNSAYISTLWYERDVRKKFQRSEQVAPGCSNMGITYRSKESRYGVQTDSNPWNIDPNYYQDIWDNNNLSGLEIRKKMY